MERIERTYFSEMLEGLNRKDLRSVASWCEKNKVKVFFDGKMRYVLTEDFNRAYNAPVLEYYNEHLSSWDEIYQAKLAGNSCNLNSETYVPKSSSAKRFLSSFN